MSVTTKAGLVRYQLWKSETQPGRNFRRCHLSMALPPAKSARGRGQA